MARNIDEEEGLLDDHEVFEKKTSKLREDHVPRSRIIIWAVLLTFGAVLLVFVLLPVVGYIVNYSLGCLLGPLDPLNPYPTKPLITYREDKTFKLVVFSDVHYGEAQNTPWGPIQDAQSDRVMRQALAAEKPDFVVINGDLITGDDTFKENSTTYIDILLQPLIDAKIPFATTFGNHDNHVNISHLDEINRIQKVAPLAYTRAAPGSVGGKGGEGNYWVPVYASSEATSPSLVVWFFDSRSGNGPDNTPYPDWVDESVATWIEDETTQMNKVWGDAVETGRQAIAFVHIPPTLMQGLQKTLNSDVEPGQNADNLGIGSVQSSLGLGTSPTHNEYLTWWNSLVKNVPNIIATVHGHDHGNEWCSRDPASQVVLCFNKHTGYGGYDGAGWGHGVRTFNLKLGEKGARTYIRYENGTVHADITLDENYDVKLH